MDDGRPPPRMSGSANCLSRGLGQPTRPAETGSAASGKADRNHEGAEEQRGSAARVAGVAAYDRERDLPALLPFWPNELRNLTFEGHHRLIQRLRRSLREERRRGLAGSWTYDLARHVRLHRALNAEIALLPKPLSSWAARPFDHPEPGAHLNRDACRGPSSSRAESGPRHSSARPSDNREEAATSSDIPQATSCSEFANDASET